MNGIVTGLFHYPIKGLSAQRLDDVTLTPGEGFPFDRVFGFARHNSGYDPNTYTPLPKQRFLVLINESRLAELTTHFDPETRTLAIEQNGHRVLLETLSTEAGVSRTIAFLADLLGIAETELPVFAEGGENRFTDVSVVSKEMMNAVSLINLDSVAELERRSGNTIDPGRFRGNLYFKGWAPFSELELVDREVLIGDARLKICKRTRRCAATEVNPVTAERDLPVPRLLHDHFGHLDMGIYAEVLEGGEIKHGSIIEISDRIS